MTTIAFPTFARPLPYTQWHFGQEPNDRVLPSPHSGQTQTVEMPGTRWGHSLRLEGLHTDERQMIAVFFAQLRGRANRYTLHDVLNAVPRGTLRGTLTTNGSITAGAVACSITGGAGQAAKTLLKGDKLSIGGELKMIVADATANGSGVIAVTVEPPFRLAVSNGASVVWDKPTAKFIRVTSTWRMEHAWPRYGVIALDGVEDFS